jgi:site-specific recombinase XerD
MTNQEILFKLEEDIQLMGLSPATFKQYSSDINVFLRHINNKPLEDCSENDIRSFLLYLLKEKKIATRTINRYNSALRFLFCCTMERILNLRTIPRLKSVRKLPEIMSKEQINSLFESCDKLRDKAILMTIYGGGLRLSEVCNLKGSDILSSSMRIKIRNGKGGKDRFTILSKKNLDILIDYYKNHRPNHPSEFLFLTSTGAPITRSVVYYAFNKAAKKAGLPKSFHIHTLRHDFATHLLQAGTDIFQIKNLLGHSCIKTTSLYLQLSEFHESLVSPLDLLENKSMGGQSDA